MVAVNYAAADRGEIPELLACAPVTNPLVWMRRGEGLVAWGEAARFEARGPDRAERAAQWWNDRRLNAEIVDEVSLPGSGLLAFGSFVFDNRSADTAVLIVPSTIVGRRGQITWVTTIDGTGTALRARSGMRRPLVRMHNRALNDDLETPRRSNGSLTDKAWLAIVTQALEAISRGDIDKVVLARDEWIRGNQAVDIRRIAGRLATTYERCWTYAVDAMVGATPEMLVRSVHGLVTSRVLAGTIRHTDDEEDNLRRAQALLRSSKDLAEHEFAVASVASRLTAFTEELNVPEEPYVLRLPNVMHLATDVTGVALRNHKTPPTCLDMAAALHPTAAVCGTPTQVARDLIAQWEAMDRGRYAGPVGWVGANGDGEWGIALRGARFTADLHSARLFAGGGIVAGSVPEEELAETEAKLAPMRQAFRRS